VNELETKKELIQRIVACLNPVPANCVQELLGQSAQELEFILDKLATTKAQSESEEVALAHAEETRRASAFDGAFGHALLNTWLNGKRLVDAESNRAMLESLLQPHEEPSAAIYSTIALSYPSKFSWEIPRPIKTDADREAEFVKTCHENLLSLCEANRQMHKDGVALENWAGASGIERAAFQEEAAKARQTFLIKHATLAQLKAEAAYESQVNRDAAVKAEADRAHKFVSEQQRGLYPPLPAVNGNGEALDARYFRRTSTIDFNLFKTLVKRYGSSQITSRLRGEN
jgi:hypothetical protein